MKIKLSKDLPPNIEEISKHFPWEKNGTVFTYGDTLYNVPHDDISGDLRAHEETHMRQQGEGNPLRAESWWKQYFRDKNFRIDQEIEAYHAQYKYFCAYNADRNKRSSFLHQLAADMSSPMYGSVIGFSRALERIIAGK